jgi:pullulanase
VDYTRINYSGFAWASYAWHCVNYAAAHDNLTLYDKLSASAPCLNEADYMRLVNLAAAIVLTSQGIPFLMLGIDMMRSKKCEHNSYNLPDEINQIDWSQKCRYQQVFNYHKGLIALRKAHPAFRMVEAEEIRKNLEFYQTPDWVITFSINNHANEDPWSRIFVAYNAGINQETISLPQAGTWHVAVDENRAGNVSITSFTDSSAVIPSRSALVLYLE